MLKWVKIEIFPQFKISEEKIQKLNVFLKNYFNKIKSNLLLQPKSKLLVPISREAVHWALGLMERPCWQLSICGNWFFNKFVVIFRVMYCYIMRESLHHIWSRESLVVCPCFKTISMWGENWFKEREECEVFWCFTHLAS